MEQGGLPEDDVTTGRNGGSAPLTRYEPAVPDTGPVCVEDLDVRAASEVLDCTLRDAVARPWDRDSMDQRIVEPVHARSGRTIDSQDDVGGYPEDRKTHCALDVPQEGIHAWLDSIIESTKG